LFEVEDTLNNGLYRPAKFYHGLPFNRFNDSLTIANGFTDYWDAMSNSPYSFNPDRKLFATYDNSKSLQIKTNYAIKNKLKGLMFWQLTEDVYINGLLHTIDETKKASLF
jgi:chitinase